MKSFVRKIRVPLLGLYFFSHMLPVYAAQEIAGQIQEISPLENKEYKLVLKTEKGESTFTLTPFTIVGSNLLAKNLEVGQKILLNQNRKGLRPQDVAAMGPPQLPKAPQLPKIPEKPEPPKLPEPPIGEPPPEGEPQGPPGPPPPPAEDTSQPKEDPRYKMEPPKPISEASEEQTPDALSQKVLTLKKVKRKIQVDLEDAKGGKESVTLKASQKVMKLLSIQDLQKQMKVKLSVAPNTKQNIVEIVTVE